MVNLNRPEQKVSGVFKNVHSCLNSIQEISTEAVLLDLLKAFERRLQERGFFGRIDTASFHPLWFLAETERNVFLWRNGYSLSEAAQFEFWIDVEAVVKKRLLQLDPSQSDNPFQHSFWGLSVDNDHTIEDEQEYLSMFLAQTAQVIHHLHALSRVGSELRTDSALLSNVRYVVLPSSPLEQL